jgi:hypothetical protein
MRGQPSTVCGASKVPHWNCWCRLSWGSCTMLMQVARRWFAARFGHVYSPLTCQDRPVLNIGIASSAGAQLRKFEPCRAGYLVVSKPMIAGEGVSQRYRTRTRPGPSGSCVMFRTRRRSRCSMSGRGSNSDTNDQCSSSLGATDAGKVLDL